jgi:hypothetical protein
MKIDLSNRSKKLLSLTFIVFVMVVACVKQDIQPIPQTAVKVRNLDRVLKAIEWLNNELPPNTKSTTEWIPLWESAFTEESNTSQTVEVPLSFLKEQLIVLPECKNKFIQTKDYKYLQNITRLIVETNPKTGEIRGYFMSIVPSLNYLEKTNFKPFNNSYLDRDSQFTGCIIFRDLEGKLVNGWIYLDGRIISSMKPAFTTTPATKVTEYCQTTYTVYYTEWTHNNNDIITYGNFSFSESTSCWTVDYSQASIDDMNGGGGGGPGSYGGGDAVTDDGIIYDEQSLTLIKPVIDNIRQDCAGSALLNSLTNYGIKFEYVVGQGNPMSFRPDSKRITWYLEIVSAPQVFHELFHAYQQMSGWSLSNNLNAEIEAYLAFYKYSIKNGFDLPNSPAPERWHNAFQPYIVNPTQNNYQTMAEFVRNLGYPNYFDNPDLRSTPNVNSIFNCY